MIPEGWLSYKLSELIDLIGGGTPKTDVPEYWNGNIPWLSVVDFGNSTKHVCSTEKKITAKGLIESSTKILKKGYLVISARGTVGELAMLGDEMAFNQSCYGINSKDKTINDYIYYLIKHNVNQIKRKTHGAVFDTITRLTFDNIDVQIPVDLKEQSRIASILSALDDKIELNLQMNKTLEAIAQAIFKEWFLDFRFPGFDGVLVDGLPKGWRKGYLSDILDLQYGKALKSEDRRQGNYPVIGSSGIVGLHDTFYVRGPGIVIGRKGTIGKVIWIDQNFFPIDTTFFIKDLLGTSSLYYHYFLLQAQSFQKISSDSAVPGLNKNEALRNNVIVPQVEIVNRYNEIAKSLFEKMNLINIENNSLTQLRDILLPKLMTGKIKVA
jgi:type I restriction enzyme S subunit